MVTRIRNTDQWLRMLPKKTIMKKKKWKNVRMPWNIRCEATLKAAMLEIAFHIPLAGFHLNKKLPV
jgi:hypothetical protein